ncbi:MAG: hypothetical protein OXE59_01365 [Bacteroidetes bacterium]|nr:hypothetical protein [Bacteroidota bacterium]
MNTWEFSNLINFVPIGILLLMSCSSPASKGIFDGVATVGNPSLNGELRFDPSSQTYSLTSTGGAIDSTNDDFFFSWKQVEGDLILEANVELSDSPQQHGLKAGWTVRESLEANAVYVNAVVHKNGIIAIEWRSQTDGNTHEISTPVIPPATLRLERTANLFTLYVDRPDHRTVVVANITVDLPQSIYAGLVVFDHDSSAVTKAQFSKVGIQQNQVNGERIIESTLEIINSHTGERQIVRQVEQHIEAPNWSPDSLTLLYNSEGRLYHLPSTGGEPKMLDTDFADRCNNDHGYSPDGTEIALSHNTSDRGSLIYIVPSSGGIPMHPEYS